MTAHQRYAGWLGGIFLVLWIAIAIDPSDRYVWIAENSLVVVVLAVLVWTSRRFPFSRVSYTLIFLFLCLHEIGAYYTYTEVPYNEWTESLFGSSLNEWMGWERNHFDRLVHFSYGLLLAYPVRELFYRIADTRGIWAYLLPLDITISTSAIFELIEWGVVALFGDTSDSAYLGTQGDIWDAHKDVLMASLGAFLAMAMTATINYRLQRDFNKEMADSLHFHKSEPLGEDEMARMLEDADSGPVGL